MGDEMQGDGTPSVVSCRLKPVFIHPKTKKVTRTAASDFETIPAPTEGPLSVPVDDPPILNPRKTEAMIPTNSSTVRCGFVEILLN